MEVHNVATIKYTEPTAPVAGDLKEDTDVAHEVYIDPALERRVLRRFDTHLAPLFCALYFMAYLDRSNIGNAAVAGMPEQLGLSEAQLSTSISAFYATYVTLMVPYVLALKKIKAHRAIAGMATAWALVTIGTAFARSFGSLLACRLLLGICQAGFFPCVSLYITMVYDRHEQGKRFAYLFAASAFSGMFGGLVATGITKIGEVGGLRSWSWLFIIEGLLSLMVVPWVWYMLPESPVQARWWSDEERRVVEMREIRRQIYMGAEAFDRKQVISAFKDWRLYTGALTQICHDLILYGYSSFLPSILRNGLGFSSLEAQYLSVPVYFLGGVSFFAAAVIGDRFRLRGSILFILDIFSICGYAILLSVENSAIRYFACFLIAIPLYCGSGLNETWIVNNAAPHYRRAAFLGFSQMIGNVAGVIAPQVYRKAPYRLGHWTSLGSILLGMSLIALHIAAFLNKNAKKEKISRELIADDRKVKDGEGDLGFRYVY